MSNIDINAFLSDLKRYWEENDIPNITWEWVTFLRQLLSIKKSNNLLEIWTANGFSAINIALELKKYWWKMTTIEFSPLSRGQALENFEKAWVWKNILSLEWNALDIIPTLEEKYDFVFIDWMKKRYLDFLNLVWDKVESSWIILLDDVIKFRYKMEDLYEFLNKKNITHSVLQIDEDDGVILIIKP